MVLAQCAGAVVAAAAAAAGARPGADGGLAMGGVGAGADGGFWRPCSARGASVAGFAAPGTARGRCWIPATQGGDGAGTLQHFYGCGRDRCGTWGPHRQTWQQEPPQARWGQPMFWKPGGGQSQGPASRQPQCFGTGMGLCFLFAPGCHPDLAKLAPLRRSLGIRSVPCLTFWGHWSIPQARRSGVGCCGCRPVEPHGPGPGPVGGVVRRCDPWPWGVGRSGLDRTQADGPCGGVGISHGQE